MGLSRVERVEGCLLGTAVGDSLGLPLEGLSPARAKAFLDGGVAHHFLAGRGMVSDDTEHVCLTALSLIDSEGDPERFQSRLATHLRWWLAAFPAGVGFATLRAILKLWLGFAPGNSGVFSAGNGPAMRSTILGVAFGADPGNLEILVRLSTIITHSDPKAEAGAIAAAKAAFLSDQFSTGAMTLETLELEIRSSLEKIGPAGVELSNLVGLAADSAGKGQSTLAFSRGLGLEKGISGYMFHTIPCVLHAWFRSPGDFRSAMTEILSAGGDADTTGAILGGIAGAGVGRVGIPPEWIAGILDWPWNPTNISILARSLGEGDPQLFPRRHYLPFRLARNLFFLGVVLLHGFRRLFN